MPFSLKLEKRLEISRKASYLVPMASVVLALLFGAILLRVAGANPWETYRAMLEGAIGSPAQWREGQYFSLVETLVKAIPIMLTGLSVAIAFRPGAGRSPAARPRPRWRSGFHPFSPFCRKPPGFIYP